MSDCRHILNATTNRCVYCFAWNMGDGLWGGPMEPEEALEADRLSAVSRHAKRLREMPANYRRLNAHEVAAFEATRQ